MNTATMRFRSISAILRDLNQAGLKLQTDNDLLTMYVGAASQHALRTTFVPYEEAVSFDNEIVAYWSGRDVTSPLFQLPLRMGGLGVGSAVQRHAAAPWTAWQTVIPTLKAATDLTDTDALLAATPTLRGQLLQLQSTRAQQMNTPALLLNPLGAALRTHGIQKTLVGAIQRYAHKQIIDSHVDNPIQRAISHLQQPDSEACEADDRCFQVSMARRLMLAHPAAALATNISPTCPNGSAAKRVCTCPIDRHQLHCIVCKSGGGVDQRHSALARCLADLITTHTGVKVHLEQTIPEIPRVPRPGAQPEGARMDIVFNLHGQVYYIDTAVVTPFSANMGLMFAASARPGHMAKREEKKKFA